MFLNNRHDDPTLGTFTSVDPLVIQTGQPYIYGNANPVTYSDPSGLEPRPIHDRNWTNDNPHWSGYENSTPGDLNADENRGKIKSYNFSNPLPLSVEWATCMSQSRLGVRSCGTPAVSATTYDGAYEQRYRDNSILSKVMRPHQILWCGANPISCKHGNSNTDVAEEQWLSWRADNRFIDFDTNAMLHTLWMALNAQDMPDSDARGLGIAHEMDWRDSYVDTARDLLNNEIGISIGNQHATFDDVVAAVEQAALTGELWCISGAGNVGRC